MSRPKIVVSISVIFVLMLLAADYGIKSYKNSKHERLMSNAVRAPSKIYHHGLLPNKIDKKHRYGNIHYELITNSLGFRDGNVRDVPLKSPKKRILLIGDSFAEGVGVNFNDSFAGQLSEKFKAKGIELLNASVSSYTPTIHLSKIKHLIETVSLDFNEVLLLLDVSDIVDELAYQLDGDGNVLQPGKSAMDLSFDYQVGPFGAFVQQNFFFAAQAFQGYHCRRFPKRCYRRPFGNARARWTVDKELFEWYGRSGLKKATQQMDQLFAMLSEKKIPLGIVVYPWPDQLREEDRASIQVHHWERWAKGKGVKFYNLFPLFFHPNWNQWFLKKDMHWNSEGHRRVAEYLFKNYDTK